MEYSPQAKEEERSGVDEESAPNDSQLWLYLLKRRVLITYLKRLLHCVLGKKILTMKWNQIFPCFMSIISYFEVLTDVDML